MLVPIVLDRATLRFDLPAMTATARPLYLLSIDGALTRPDGVILLLGAVAYTAGLVRVSRRDTTDLTESPAADAATTADRHRLVLTWLLLTRA